ncbi:sensor histidine kinase [Caldimonas caldifontis]|uniref:histidine kinase n=1 Tax=Caldimonas caldifontis TaxID=1452508 RepID=A0A2S5SQX1_9BURK|nr:ATP-binding protein [Caldimonas caldifontis]PPE65120.1 two-component sensor histidine kinase [Caldimonas caldifontis]
MNTERWHQRAGRRLRHSIQLRMVLVFLLLAAAMTFVLVSGAQRAFSVGWREAARPMLADYVDRLASEVTAGGATPQIERAEALVRRLPITVRIEGPRVQWASHDDTTHRDWEDRRDRRRLHDGPPLLERVTADGHRLSFGIDEAVFERRPRLIGYALAAVLLITGLAWLYVRRLLRPLNDISAGARRFGAGDFGEPIPVRHPRRPDELGQLALTINTMGHDIHQMLEAKRALLLAISHELRSPITRARLNAELLPEDGEVRAPREALLRDLQEMATLVSDLLESERLATRHAALQREPTDLGALVAEVLRELGARHAGAPQVTVHVQGDLSALPLDAARIRLLLRNLLDNALRHGGDAARPPELHLRRTAAGVEIEVRDHGPGVPEAQLQQLAEAFYRPDSARTRTAGGVGLGLYLCRLVARAHGGTLTLRNAEPGLSAVVVLPGA